MGQGVHILMKNPSDFSFSLKFDDVENQADNLAWGKLSVMFAGQLLWSQQDLPSDEPTLVDWTWSDLLAFLGKNWTLLKFEEAYPLNLNPPTPVKLRDLANERWEGMDTDQIDDEDEEVFHFERRHDLASGLNGVFLPSLIVMREGNIAWVCSDRECLRLDYKYVMSVLGDVGEAIAAQLQDSTNPRALLALKAWRNRDSCSHEKVIELRSGMKFDNASLLAGGVAANDFWELDEEFDDSEVLAAARFSSGVLNLETQKYILEEIKRYEYVSTPELDSFSEECVALLEGLKEKPSYAQGYEVAGWLRERLGITEDFSPEIALTNWGVKIGEIKVPRTLEALAFWGRKHGPTVLVNTTEGALCTRTQGLRSTLAHEIGHLLMDRSGSLPFADAIGGTTPGWVEKRARAFAAELLLPRNVASAAVEAHGVEDISPEELEQEILRLSTIYKVSTGLVIHQLKNSRLLRLLPEKTKAHLSRRNQEVSPLGERAREF